MTRALRQKGAVAPDAQFRKVERCQFKATAAAPQ
jgi:hypothetical protein